MGPRHRCRGIRAAVRGIYALSRAASMGPRHRCRGIVLDEPVPRRCIALQWGRGIDAAEFCRSWRTSRWPACASMGPRHRCRGISDASGPAAAVCTASMGPRHRCRGIGLRHSRSTVQSRASMGPRHRCRGIVRCMSQARGTPHASMGPRHRCRGISCSSILFCFQRPAQCVASGPRDDPELSRSGEAAVDRSPSESYS